jgi:hypothetical protein
VLGAGELSFNLDGSLRRVEVSKPLRYAEPDGQSVLELGLDFGAGTDTGGLGVDGTTNLDAAPVIVNLSARGSGPDVGQPCADSTLLLQTLEQSVELTPDTAESGLSLAQAPTRSVFSSGNLPPSEPLRTDVFDLKSPAETSSFAAFPEQICDASGRTWLLTFYARHISANDWQYVYVATSEWGSVDTGLATLEFDDRGRLLNASPPMPLRLPLSDGSPGPLIDMPGGTPVEAGGDGVDWLTEIDGIELPAQLQLQVTQSAQQAFAR